MRVALHDELADLRAQVGPQVFNDPVAFRAAFDDFIPEGSASTGEVSLLVGAIATGALQRLLDQLQLGADPATSIAVQGDLLARDRGTSESDGARWALSVLAHASGFVPADLVLTKPSVPDSLDVPERPTRAATDEGVVDPGPTQSATVERGTPRPTVVHPGLHPGAGSDHDGGGGRRTNVVLIVVAAVLAVVAVTALVLLLARDGDTPDGDADRTSESQGDGTASPEGEEVLGEIEMTSTDRTVRVQLVRDDADVDLVLLSDRDGSFTEVARVPVGCPYLETSYAPVLQDQGEGQIFWAWQNNGTDGYGGYGEVRIEEEMLISYEGDVVPCPGDPVD